MVNVMSVLEVAEGESTRTFYHKMSRYLLFMIELRKKSIFNQVDAMGNKTNLVIGLTSSVVAVFTLTTLTRPSTPGHLARIRAKGHRAGGVAAANTVFQASIPPPPSATWASP